MHRNSPLSQLTEFINKLDNEDHIWIIHILNKDHLEYINNITLEDQDYELVQKDINDIKTANNANDLKSIILNKIRNIPYDILNHLFILMQNYKSRLLIREHDLSKYKSNERLLRFSLYKITNKDINFPREIAELKNEYLKFIYLIYVYRNSYTERNGLNYAEEDFSNIITAMPLHFKKNDNIDFYRWVKGYLDNDRDRSSRYANSKQYTPLTDEDYKVTINSIFDILLDAYPDTYKVLKDKLSNAWYQKSYRKKNKGKKHYYFLTDKTHECLKKLASKHNKTEDKIIDLLINKDYVEEFLNKTGDNVYSR